MSQFKLRSEPVEKSVSGPRVWPGPLRPNNGSIALPCLLQVFSGLYRASGNTVRIVEAYLSVFATGKYEGPAGSDKSESLFFDQAQHDPRQALAASPVLELLEALGEG